MQKNGYRSAMIHDMYIKRVQYASLACAIQSSEHAVCQIVCCQEG